jgi:hypothetical protein
MSAALIGDVVAWRGEEWVVAGKFGSPKGTIRYVRLVRRDGPRGVWRGIGAYETEPTLVRRPEFAIGHQVKLNGWEGEIVSAAPEQHAGEALWRCRRSSRVYVTARGTRLVYEPHETLVAAWHLTLEGNA